MYNYDKNFTSIHLLFLSARNSVIYSQLRKRVVKLNLHIKSQLLYVVFYLSREKLEKIQQKDGLGLVANVNCVGILVKDGKRWLIQYLMIFALKTKRSNSKASLPVKIKAYIVQFAPRWVASKYTLVKQ